MTLRSQQWVPDTHPAYKLDTEWDYSGEEATFVRCLRATLDDVELPEPDAVYALILAENQTKNRALAALKAVLPDLDPVWVFGAADGIVNLSLPGATPSQMLVAQAALDEFGEAVRLG